MQLEKLAKLRQQLRSGQSIEWHSEHLSQLRAAYRTYPAQEIITRRPDPIVEFTDGIGRVIERATAYGSRVVVLAQPTLWKPAMTDQEREALWFFVNTQAGRVRASPAWLAREMAAYNQAQRRQAQARGATYVPLDELVPKTLENFYDDCHFTDAGSRAVAVAILPTVQSIAEQVATEHGW